MDRGSTISIFVTRTYVTFRSLANSASSLADYLVSALKQLGVRHIFGVTGHSIFQITDAIDRQPGIDFVPARSELAAAYVAEGYARAGRQLGVCLVSVGPGALNIAGGVAADDIGVDDPQRIANGVGVVDELPAASVVMVSIPRSFAQSR
jgi:TPP-dependent trihydroxycyclohexane-1,2-dione (THcHDO) dehydratase